MPALPEVNILTPSAGPAGVELLQLPQGLRRVPAGRHLEAVDPRERAGENLLLRSRSAYLWWH